jgi:hypothetical protein
MMCGDRWLETGSPWEGDEMTFKTINEVLAEYSEEYIVECVNKARATPALPQGVEEWINKKAIMDCDVMIVTVYELRKFLSGMAIVPKSPTEEMAEAGCAVLQSAQYLDMSTAATCYEAMLAAAKEKGE